MILSNSIFIYSSNLKEKSETYSNGMSWNIKTKYYLNYYRNNCKAMVVSSWTFHDFLKSFKEYFLALCLALLYITIKSFIFKITYIEMLYNKLHCAS